MSASAQCNIFRSLTTLTTLSTSAVTRRALAHLRKTDERIARVIAQVGACRFTPRAEGTHFDALLRAIVYQQLSGKAASTILGRVLALYGDRYPTAAELLSTPEEQLRAAGLSRQKLSYVRDLARHVHEGLLPVDQLDQLDDAAIIESLTAVKGIGRWSAQMFLMFRLGRPDVLPELDLGIRKGLQRAYRMRKLPTPKRVQAIGARWSPYSSYACWYLWRSLDGDANLAD
ncbi:MAG TPA: DNA-3-methyladenine glycosylase [Gemmatimonadaceae bacterium]|nr:DNA-3-methyladenine glycosylase [Gemmatimonadaceae bacterium]